MDITNEIKLLMEYNDAYREGEPLVSDSVYDKLYRDAKDLYPDDPFFHTVQGISDDFGRKVPLEFILGSLRNFHYYPDKSVKGYKTGDDIEEFISKYNDGSGWIVQDKVDGLSILVTWENFKLSHAELRGKDGEIGVDVTDKIKVILKRNKTIKIDKLVLRGEIVLDCPNPSILGLKNRRNGAVGIIKREDFSNIDYLKIYFYELVQLKDDRYLNTSLNSLQKFQLIKQNGLNLVRYEYIDNTAISADMVKNIHQQLVDGGSYIQGLYDIDGKVIFPNNYIREDVKLPLGKVALKKKSEFIKTTIRKVDCNTSRTGKVIPRVEYDPIEYGGATLSSATAFNFAFIKDNKLGVGSTVLISRSQEVIPKVETVLESIGCVIPSECPSCGYDLLWDENGVHLMCNSMECPAQSLKNIAHFFISLGLENYSETSFKKLKVNSIFEVYNLTQSDIESIDGFGSKSAIDFVQRVEETKRPKLEQLLVALNINFLGNSLSRLLVANYSWEDIKNVNFDIDQLSKLEGVGSKKANFVINGLKKRYNVIKRLEEEYSMVPVISSGLILSGKTFCITGALSKPRKIIEKIIIDNGGAISGIKKIDNMYLVCNEKSRSSKYLKAESLGIPIITEDELCKMIS